MRKGFTLIELLAVIVILAIIALIATPIILGIINDAREDVNKRSVENYAHAVELAVARYSSNHGGLIPYGKYHTDDGKTLIKISGDSLDGLEIQYNGNKLTAEIEITKDGKIILIKVKFPGVEKEYSYSDQKGVENFSSICKLIDGEEKKIGSKYVCKVKDEMEKDYKDGYVFYVLGNNDYGTTNLIMERNIYYDKENDIGLVATETTPGLVRWNAESNQSTNFYGPVTAMNYLYNATKDWNNVPNIIMNYTDEEKTDTSGYGSIKTVEDITQITKQDGTIVNVLDNQKGYKNLKSRMPFVSELESEEVGCSYEIASCPGWVVDYLNYYKDVTGVENIPNIYGYWTLASSTTLAPYEATEIVYWGGVVAGDVKNDTGRGVRPVITIKL